MKFGQFMSYYKRKIFIKKFYKNCDLKTSFRLFCVCKELSATPYWKMKFLKQPSHIKYVITNDQNLSKSACIPPQIPFYRGFFENLKGLGTSFQATFFIKCFDESFSFVILHGQYYIWPNFITKLCLLSKLFSKMHFMFHA